MFAIDQISTILIVVGLNQFQHVITRSLMNQFPTHYILILVDILIACRDFQSYSCDVNRFPDETKGILYPRCPLHVVSQHFPSPHPVLCPARGDISGAGAWRGRRRGNFSVNVHSQHPFQVHVQWSLYK